MRIAIIPLELNYLEVLKNIEFITKKQQEILKYQGIYSYIKF